MERYGTYAASIFYMLALAVLAFFIVTLFIVSIVKLVHYLNGKPIFTPNKLTRKLLGAEMGLAVILFLIGYVMM